MFKIICWLAGLAVAFGSDCQTLKGGECHTILVSCPSQFEFNTYNYCGFLSHCCYNEHSSGHVTSAPTSTSDGSCGISAVNDNHRIVNGTRASEGEYPWQVSLRLHGTPVCGGTLIDNQHVLTAAHCFIISKDATPSHWTVGVGTTNLNYMTGSHVRSVSQIHVHTGYSRSSEHNDIAIMRLSSPLDLSGTRVRTACLPHAGERFDHRTCTVTGWGTLTNGGPTPTHLMEVDLPIVSNNVCRYYMENSRHSIVSSQICAGVVLGGKDSCQGDSGGPLACKKDGLWKVAGVVSWGNRCALRNTVGIYTRVSEFLDWIAQHTRD